MQDYGRGQGGGWYFAGHPAAGYYYIFLPNVRVCNKTADERKLARMNKGGPLVVFLKWGTRVGDSVSIITIDFYPFSNIFPSGHGEKNIQPPALILMRISATDTAAGGVGMMVWEKGGGVVYLLKISRRCAQGWWVVF